MVVMNENKAEYVRLMNEMYDARLLSIAVERFAHYDSANVISEEEMDQRLGITEGDLADYEDVEFE